MLFELQNSKLGNGLTATVMDANETNLLSGDASVASAAAITAQTTSSGSAPQFLSGSAPGAAPRGIAPLDDTPAGGISTVPPDVYDKNFGPNYSIIYSPENVAGGYYFDGGLGADQYTGYQGDPGNFGGAVQNQSVADALNSNNAQGGEAAYTQYAVAQALDQGNLAAAIQTVERATTLVAGAAGGNSGGDPATGAREIANSPAAHLVTDIVAFIGVLAFIASPPIGGGIMTFAVAAGSAEDAAGQINAAHGSSQPPGYIPSDANTQAFYNSVGRVAAEAGRASAAYYSMNPQANVSRPPLGGASPHLLASVASFSTDTGGHPIVVLAPHA